MSRASSAPLRGVKDEILRCTRVEYQRVTEGGDSLLSPSLSAEPADYFSGFYFYKKFPKYYQSVFGGQRIIPVGSDWSDMSDEIYPKVILL